VKISYLVEIFTLHVKPSDKEIEKTVLFLADFINDPKNLKKITQKLNAMVEYEENKP
jgi:hypothetical protein